MGGQRFYKEKGDRPIVRPELLPPTLAEYKQRMEEMLTEVQNKASLHIKQSLAGTFFLLIPERHGWSRREPLRR